MNYSTLRYIPRDSVLYSLLRESLRAYAKGLGVTNYGVFFSEMLGYSSKTKGIQFLSSIQDDSYRKFSVDEFVILVRSLGEGCIPVVNRLLENTGLLS